MVFFFVLYFIFFFFSSRRRHTRFDCDWSSDVCSSDLAVEISAWNEADTRRFAPLVEATAENFDVAEVSADKAYLSKKNLALVESVGRSEERRVGKECRSRGARYH